MDLTPISDIDLAVAAARQSQPGMFAGLSLWEGLALLLVAVGMAVAASVRRPWRAS
jgi:hypothetical protein